MTKRASSRRTGRSLRVAGLFAGIGGIELGLGSAGHHTELLCEIEPEAANVLRTRLPDPSLHGDITKLRSLPAVEVVAAGFPCQDLSLAGTRAGLAGTRSGLVGEVFRLIRRSKPEFLLFENVSNLLRLDRGAAIRSLLDTLEEHRYRWAYRLVDTRGFGIPQRRLRVIILASIGDVDPADVLFTDEVEPVFDDSIGPLLSGHSYGFYWTEGKRGVGWAKDAVPTIKGGSGLGIPSPPAIFDVDARTAGTPTICDAERLQGFPQGWTDVPYDGKSLKLGSRWRMVGNAVSVPVAEWVGDALALPGSWDPDGRSTPLDPSRPMPHAAFGSRDGRFRAEVSTHVRSQGHEPITEFLHEPLKPLSVRALTGYLHRATTGHKKFPDGFLEALGDQIETHLDAPPTRSVG